MAEDGEGGGQRAVADDDVRTVIDAAQATSYFHAQHIRVGAPGGGLYVLAGTYRDRLRRTAAGWAILERAQEYTCSRNPDVIVRGDSPEQQS